MSNPFYAAQVELNRFGRRRGVEECLIALDAEVKRLREGWQPLNDAERLVVKELARQLAALAEAAS